MTGSDVEALLRNITTVGATLAAVVAIVRWVVQYQTDFTNRYRSRVAELETEAETYRGRIDALEDRLDKAEENSRVAVRRAEACEEREAMLRREIIAAGVPLRPAEDEE